MNENFPTSTKSLARSKDPLSSFIRQERVTTASAGMILGFLALGALGTAWSVVRYQAEMKRLGKEAKNSNK